MLKKILLFGLLLALGGTFYGYDRLEKLYDQKITHTRQFLVIEKGTSARQLAKLLEDQGIAKDTGLLPLMLRIFPDLSHFKAGVYSLDGIDTVEQLLKHLNSGKEVQLAVQVIEGKTFTSWRGQLAKAPYLTQTLADKSEAEIAQQLGIPYQKPEGWFAPDTYHYTPYSNDVDILQRAYQKMQKELNTAWENRAPDLPLKDAYEMLTLASIVEKETAVASERAQVASVFINRLKLKMKLQTDPSVIYGMGDNYEGNIRKKDLQEATAYNTYVIDGLPPTPIAMPSVASLKAVSQPAQTDYLYFVADGSGGHKFSRTLSEHNQAVADYVKWLRSQKAKEKTK